MNGSGKGPWLAVVAIVVAVAVGFVGYNIGLSQTVVTGGAPAAVGYYGHPYGFGFGFFGLLFPLLFFFLIFSALRALLWGGHRHGYGPGRWGDDRASRLEEWHRRAHDDVPRDPGARSTGERT